MCARLTSGAHLILRALYACFLTIVHQALPAKTFGLFNPGQDCLCAKYEKW